MDTPRSRSLIVLVAVSLPLAGLGATGCTESRTEVIVVVDSDLDVPAEIDGIVVEVTSPAGAVQQAEMSFDDGSTLPATLGLAHEGGPLGPFDARAVGRLAGESVVERSARFFFVAGETRTLELHLVKSCIGHPCPEGETCADGECRGVEISPEEMSPWNGEPPTLPPTGGDGDADADSDGDGDIDAQTDADVDAPTDADVDAPTDADVDTPTDADVDAPTDADVDAPTDADADTPTDADVDAPTDADVDAPTDAGVDAGCPGHCTCDSSCSPSCACADGCPCDLTCSGDCEVTCTGAGTTCTVDAAGISNLSEFVCEDGASCIVDFTGGSNMDSVARCSGAGTSCDVDCTDASNCSLDCLGGASCLLRCGGSMDLGNCSFAPCASGETLCADNVRACGRACP